MPRLPTSGGAFVLKGGEVVLLSNLGSRNVSIKATCCLDIDRGRVELQPGAKPLNPTTTFDSSIWCVTRSEKARRKANTILIIYGKPARRLRRTLSSGRYWPSSLFLRDLTIVLRWSGRADLNGRPLAPQASALTRLRHVPTILLRT